MSETRQVAVIGAGLVGAATAWELLRTGHRVTLVDPDEPGGEQAASYGNAGWISSHSIIPPSSPDTWRHVPRYVLNPLGPLAIRWTYLPRAAPWLLRYVAAGNSVAKLERSAAALRTLLRDASVLHEQLAREAGVPDLVERSGVLHVYPKREDYQRDATTWRIRRE